MKDSVLWKEAFYAVDQFVAFNNERERNFNEYFTWLRDDLCIRTFDLSRWAIELCKLPVQSISVSEMYLESLKALYDLLSDYRESLYRTNLSYTRGGAYELAIRACLPKAWPNLRKAPVILNAENDLVPAYEDNSLAVYLNASSRYRTLRPSSIVSTRVSKDYETLFKDGFQIAEFDNYQFVKEKIIKKYIQGNGAKIGFEDETHFEREYIEDINQLLGLIEESGNTADVMALLRNAYIIKIKTEDGSNTFAFPHTVYVDTSDEGIDLLTYYAPVTMSYEVDYDEENDRPIMEEGDPYNFNHEQIDREFYEDHGVSLSKMKKLGLITTPVIEGERADYSGTGDGYWRALGEFCPNIEIDGLEDNIEYIEGNPQSELAKKKSAELMKLLLSISGKLSGVVRKRKNNPYDSHEKAAFLWSLDYNDWLFDKNGELHHPSQMSRYDLDEEIYSELPNKKEAYAVLGFVEKEADAKADTFEMVGALDRRDKTIMFRQLAKELGYDISDISRIQPTEEEDEGGTFDPNAWQSEEFPQRRVRNMDSLIEHVRQEFFCADPVRYQKVLRQIRTSKSPKTIRAYTLGMYVNESDTQICQMCKKATPYVDVTEIVNYGIEMPQLNLCLCRNCSSRYKQFRDGNKEKFKEEMTRALRNIDIGIPAEDYEIELSSDTSIHFTQTHLAEVKEILSLLEQYGIPGQEEPEKPEKQVTRNNMSSSPVNPQREKKSVYMVDHRREDQRILSEARENVSITASLEEILADPYIIFEQYQGYDVDDVIPFYKIDNGILASPDFGIDNLLDEGSTERLRAFCVDELNRIAAHSFGKASTILESVNHRLDRMPEWKRYTYKLKNFEVETEVLEETLYLRRDENNTLYLYLRPVYEDERCIEDAFKALTDRPDIVLKRAISADKFKERLKKKDSKLISKAGRQYEAILDKQAEICMKIFTKPLCVLSGAAGTGKTTVIRAIVENIKRVHGESTGFLLMAPTGKAAERIKTQTGERSTTIHSFLASNGWINNNFTLKRSGGKLSQDVNTIIVDECSMIDLNLFATLLRAINWNSIQRLILIGDPNQLPPIGRGRVFADTIAWLKAEYPENVGVLTDNIRQLVNRVDGNGNGILELANIFIQEKQTWLSISVRKGETELPLKIYNKYYQDKREVKFKFYCVSFVRKVVST